MPERDHKRRHRKHHYHNHYYYYYDDYPYDRLLTFYMISRFSRPGYGYYGYYW